MELTYEDRKLEEKKLYEKVMSKYHVMDNKKIKRIIHILDTTEGLCMPEFLEFCHYLLELDKKK